MALDLMEIPFIKVVTPGQANARVFETLDDLLAKESPIWGAKRVETLMAKLAAIEQD